MIKVSLVRFILAACMMCAMAMAARADDLTDPVCLKARPAAYDSSVSLPARPTTIVAVGSSSTEGVARNAREKLYPAAMEAALRERWPQADVRVVNKGRGGETMAQTLVRFEADVLALKPDLVIWQLGVNDVLRFQGVEGRREEIRAGLKLLADKAIPVILLDLQYAPAVLKDPDAAAMQSLIDEAARGGAHGRVHHFRRFAIMKALSEKLAVAAGSMTIDDGLHMTDAMHACVGRLLAEMVVGNPDSVAAVVNVSAKR
jgi:lysophospholipase L1-like esterase